MKEQIERALDKYARPYLHEHGGDVRLTRIEKDTAYIELLGECAMCAYADLTVGDILTEAITTHVEGIKHVAVEDMNMDFYRHAKDFVRSLHKNQKR